MQVSCSNCGARYAVDATAIGPTGRTVQCVRCNRRWFQKIEPQAGPPPAPRPPPAPDFVIRPAAQGAGLPALSPPQPRRNWGTWVAIVIGLIVLCGATAFAYRGEIAARLPPAWRAMLDLDFGRGLLTRPARAARLDASERAHLTLDIGASRIELVDGRYVMLVEALNDGNKVGSPSILKLVFRAGGEILGERTVALFEGPIPPGSRASFSLPLDEPPVGTNNIAPTLH